MTIDLTIASLTTARELEWNKEYELRESDHLIIIIEEETTTEMEHRKNKLDAVSERAQ